MYKVAHEQQLACSYLHPQYISRELLLWRYWVFVKSRWLRTREVPYVRMVNCFTQRCLINFRFLPTSPFCPHSICLFQFWAVAKDSARIGGLCSCIVASPVRIYLSPSITAIINFPPESCWNLPLVCKPILILSWNILHLIMILYFL